MERIACLLKEFPLRYRIVLPLAAFASGILLGERITRSWVAIAAVTPFLGILSLYVPGLRFLLFIPLGLLFSSPPISIPAQNITAFSGVSIDIEGDVYRSPEEREGGSRLLLDADYVIEDGVLKPVIGKLILSTSKPVRGIDYLILLSVDRDHLNGAMFFLDNFDVGHILTNGYRLDGGLWERVRESGAEWKNLLESELIRLPDNVVLEVLKSDGTFTVKDSSLPYPLFLKLTYDDVSFLVCESVYGRDTDAALLTTYCNTLESTVLYYRDIHDGNITAAFIRAVSPEIAITDSAVPEISSGKVNLRPVQD